MHRFLRGNNTPSQTHVWKSQVAPCFGKLFPLCALRPLLASFDVRVLLNLLVSLALLALQVSQPVLRLFGMPSVT